MDDSKQVSSVPIETSLTASTIDISKSMKTTCQTPTSAVRGFHGKAAWPSGNRKISRSTNEQNAPMRGSYFSCKVIAIFLMLHVLLLTLFSAVIILTRTTNNPSFSKSATHTSNGFTDMPKLLYTLRVDMIPNVSFLTSNKVPQVAVTLPAEYFTLEPDSVNGNSETNNTSINIYSAVHRIYNVDAVEVKEGSDPTALLWLSRDNHMLIIKSDKVSLVSRPGLKSLFTWILSESPSLNARLLQGRLRGRVQVNPHSSYYFGHRPMNPLLPLPELVVEQPGPNNYESIGVSSQIRLHPSAYRWATMQGNQVMGGGPTTQFRAFQGSHVPMPLFMLPPSVPYESRPMAPPPPEFEASVVNRGSNYVVPQEPMSQFYANGGFPQAMGPMAQAMGAMPQAMGSMPQAMGSMPQAMAPTP